MDRSETARLLTAAAAFSPSIAADDPRVVNAWHAVIGDLPYVAASHAVRDYYRTESWPITPAQIVGRVEAAERAARARTIPAHLACETHPDEYDYECRHCPRQIGSAHPDVMALVRQLAEQAALEAKSRDAQRVADLKRKADDAARRAAEKLERKRQLEAYAARGAPQSNETPSKQSQPTPAPDRPAESRLGLSSSKETP